MISTAIATTSIIVILFLLALIVILVLVILHLFQAQRQLTQQLNKLYLIKQAIDQHAMISIADTNGRILDVNEQFCIASGYSRAELLGQNHSLLRSQEHSSEYYQSLYKVLIQEHQVWQGEFKNKRKNGDFYWVNTTIVPFIRDQEARPFQYITVRTDITAHKQTQQRLEEAIQTA